MLCQWLLTSVLLFAQFRYEAAEFNTTETVAVVAGHKAVLEVNVRDVSLPAVVRLFYVNGSHEREIGSTAIMNWLGNAGSCAFWRKLDAYDEWFLVQRVYCKRGPYQGIPRAAFTIVLTTYPINSMYSGNFTFKIGAYSNLLHHSLTEESGREHYITKKILIVTRDWFDPEHFVAIQNLDPNYPYILDARPSHIWVREEAPAKVSLHLSNFEFPLFLLQKQGSTESLSLFYNISFVNGSCHGHFMYNAMFRGGQISACTPAETEGQYTLQLSFETEMFTTRTELRGLIAASYKKTVDETNFRMKEIASVRFNITSYSRECRAERESDTPGFYVENFGSSIFINCSASCVVRSGNLAVGVRQKSPTISDPINSICENGKATHVSGPRDKVFVDCRSMSRNVSAPTIIIVTFEIRRFTKELEGQYECSVEDHHFFTSYLVPVYKLRIPTLTLTGKVNRIFESEGQHTRLTCYAVDAQPAAKIEWLIDDAVTTLSSSYLSQPTDRGNSTSVLLLPMSHVYNGRRVRCATVARGSITSVKSNTMQVNFYYLPLDVIDELIDSNSSVNVTCNVFKSNPPMYPKNCSMSINDGRETTVYDPVPNDPLVIEPGHSALVHCFCKFNFLGRTAMAQTTIYVNWIGAVNMESEVAIMRYTAVYVSMTIGGLSILLIALFIVLRKRGYSLGSPPLPGAILSKIALGQAHIERTVSSGGYTQIVIKHRTSARSPYWVASEGEHPSEEGRLARHRAHERSAAVKKSAPAPSLPVTAMLVSSGARGKNDDVEQHINRPINDAFFSPGFGSRFPHETVSTPSKGNSELANNSEAFGRRSNHCGAPILKKSSLAANHIHATQPSPANDRILRMTSTSNSPTVPENALFDTNAVDAPLEMQSTAEKPTNAKKIKKRRSEVNKERVKRASGREKQKASHIVEHELIGTVDQPDGCAVRAARKKTDAPAAGAPGVPAAGAPAADASAATVALRQTPLKKISRSKSATTSRAYTMSMPTLLSASTNQLDYAPYGTAAATSTKCYSINSSHMSIQQYFD